MAIEKLRTVKICDMHKSNSVPHIPGHVEKNSLLIS